MNRTSSSLFARLTVALLAVVLLVGCSSSKPAPSGGSENPAPAPKEVAQDVVITAVADIVQLDPTDIGDDPSSVVAQQIMESLVKRDPGGTIIPALAEKWNTSDDGLVWTFELRQNVKFHDGSDFNADVVKWHYDRVLLDKDAPARFRKQWGDIIQEVKVVDPHKVEMVLKAPNAAFLDLVVTTNGGMIWSKANFDKLGAKDAALHPSGTGPLVFKEWVTGQKVVLEANPNYWGEKVKMNTLTFRPIPESNTQVIELETGGVHLINKLGQEDVDRLKQNKDVEVKTAPAYRIRTLDLNVTKAPFNDLRVRQAINYALDTEGIVTALVGDLAVPSKVAALPLASWGHPENLTGYKQDVAKAKALLAEAGYTADANGKLTKDGAALKVRLFSPNGRYFMDKEISEVIKNQLSAVGIEVDLQILEWAPFLEKAQSSDFDMIFLGWNQSSPDPSIFYDPKVKTGGRGNYSKYSDAQIDQWLEEAVKVTDQAQRKELYGKVAQRLHELAWQVPLYNESKVAAIRTNLKGYAHSPALTDYTTLYLEGKGL